MDEVKAVFWPLAVIAILVIFRVPLSAFIDRATTGKLSVDKSGLSVELIASSAANLGAAVASQPSSSTAGNQQGDLSRVASAATRAAGKSIALGKASVLWVDDNPNNNIYERRALSALGIEFDLATNTEEAMKLLREKGYNLVVTDFTRRDDPHAAYTLLADMNSLPSRPPVIIYSSSSSPEFQREAKSRGAYGETNKPVELYDLVVSAIVGKQEA